jgi:hypothetical protein
MIAVLCVATAAQAEMLTNAGFETGDWSGWTVRTTENGMTTVQDVVTYDIDGPGPLGESLVGHLDVGKVTAGGPNGGVEVVQALYLTAGTEYAFSANLSAFMNDEHWGNGDGGHFEFIVGDKVLETWSSGVFNPMAYKYYEMSGSYTPTVDGYCDVGLRITREFLVSTYLNQYIDNVSFVPEPASFALLALGGLAVLRRR